MSGLPRRARRRQRGLTLVEVLIATVLIAVLLVPAVDALYTGLLGSGIHARAADDHYRLLSRLETVLAEAYGDLEAAASGPVVASVYSDPAGPGPRLLVHVAAYDADDADGDADPFTGTDEDVLWVRVSIEGAVASLDALATR